MVKLITLIKRTVIKPAQTESSNTAARGEASRNIIIARMILVKAREIAALSSVPRITDQIEKNVIEASKIKSIYTTETPSAVPLKRDF